MTQCVTELDYNYILSNSRHAEIDIERCLYSFAHFIIMSRIRFAISPLQVEAISKIQNWAHGHSPNEHLMINLPIGSGKTTLARLASAWLTLRSYRLKIGCCLRHVTVMQTKAIEDLKAIAKILEPFNVGEVMTAPNKLSVILNNDIVLQCQAHGSQTTGMGRIMGHMVVDEYDRSPRSSPQPRVIFTMPTSLSIGTWEDVDLYYRPSGVFVDVVDIRAINLARTWAES